MAYLLDILPDPMPLLEMTSLPDSLHTIFGRIADASLERMVALLKEYGYRKTRGSVGIASSLAYLLLRNRSPYLEHLTLEIFEDALRHCSRPVPTKYLFQISKALYGQRILPAPLPPVLGSRIRKSQRQELSLLSRREGRPEEDSIDPEWFSWCQRWKQQTTLQDKKLYYHMLKAGRWLKIHHPEITSPAHWDYALAAEYVAAVNNMKVGEWVTQTKRLANRMGLPLAPAAKSQQIQGMRQLLRDCQEWRWIPAQLNPDRALSIPRSIRQMIKPHPRVVSKDLWAKILWAAMNLQKEDLPLPNNNIPYYPLEMVRALAIVWCFAALRGDEIRRLRVGCIRWQYEDVMIPETGEILPKDAVCFLDIPVNKTSTAYTKPVHPLVGQRIAEWEQVRPKGQPEKLDKKTSETVPFLFSFRSARISPTYINESLIPLLGAKAGIPIQDSRGKITSHRARATIASMLYNAKNPLNIFQLQKYLGHKVLSSTQHYAQVDPTKLASDVAKANYFEQNLATIEVLLDQEAIMNGQASRGEVWKYYDLGHGFCTNPFWASCAHRMACARCPFYRPKTATTEQLVEGKANLVRMLEFVSLTEDEKLLVTEGIELHQALIEKLVDVPTLAGPTPRELEAQQQREAMIPVKGIQRFKKEKKLQ